MDLVPNPNDTNANNHTNKKISIHDKSLPFLTTLTIFQAGSE